MGSRSRPNVDQVLPYTEWAWAAATTSGRAACTWEWMAKAAWFTGCSHSTTSPWWLTRRRSETRMWPKCMPKGLTQKWSVSSGSRAVMWPATPSSKPHLENMRKAAARRCLRWRRSSSTVAKVGGMRILSSGTTVLPTDSGCPPSLGRGPARPRSRVGTGSGPDPRLDDDAAHGVVVPGLAVVVPEGGQHVGHPGEHAGEEQGRVGQVAHQSPAHTQRPAGAGVADLDAQHHLAQGLAQAAAVEQAVVGEPHRQVDPRPPGAGEAPEGDGPQHRPGQGHHHGVDHDGGRPSPPGRQGAVEVVRGTSRGAGPLLPVLGLHGAGLLGSAGVLTPGDRRRRGPRPPAPISTLHNLSSRRSRWRWVGREGGASLASLASWAG